MKLKLQYNLKTTVIFVLFLGMVKNIWPSDHNYLFPIFTGWLEKNPVWMDPANQVNGRTAGQNPGY